MSTSLPIEWLSPEAREIYLHYLSQPSADFYIGLGMLIEQHGWPAWDEVKWFTICEENEAAQ